MSDLDRPVRDRPHVAMWRGLLLSHSRLHDEVGRMVAERCGLSMGQFDMLAELGGTSGMRMGDLSRQMISSPSSATRIAQSMEKKGLVVRRRSETSQRVVIAQLTDEGQAFFDEHFLHLARGLKAIVDSKLSVEEQSQLATLLEKLC